MLRARKLQKHRLFENARFADPPAVLCATGARSGVTQPHRDDLPGPERPREWSKKNELGKRENPSLRDDIYIPYTIIKIQYCINIFT